MSVSVHESPNIALYVLINLDEITLNILRYLSYAQLAMCSRVCVKWKRLCHYIQQKRKQLECALLRKGLCKDDVDNRIESLYSGTNFALIFSTPAQRRRKLYNVSLHESTSTAQAPVENTTVPSAEWMTKYNATFEGYMYSKFLQKSMLVCTSGIVGQDSVTDQASEMESGYAASCIFFPILKDDADFRVTSTQPSTSLDCPECNFANWLQRVDVTDAKLLLVFLTGAEPDDQDSTDGDPMEDQEELVMNWIQHHPNIPVAGARIPHITGPTSSQNSSRGMLFSGKSLQVATILLTRSMKSVKTMEAHMRKIADTGINTQNAFAFMLTCCGRGKGFHRKRNVESGTFQRLYPNVPLFGVFGEGEIGFDFLQKINVPIGEHQDILDFFRDIDYEDVMHSYSTVFVVLSSDDVRIH